MKFNEFIYYYSFKNELSILYYNVIVLEIMKSLAHLIKIYKTKLN